MLHRQAKVELGVWQACLALAQSRLSRPDFEAKVSQTVQVLSQQARLECSLQGLKVEIQDAGLDLIRLQFGLSGVLSTGAREVAVEGGTCAVTTSFKVVKQGAENIVVANLQDPNLSVSFDADEQPKDEQAAVIAAIELWIRDSGDDSTFELFRFNSGIGAASGASFGDFAVTTAFARFAPQYPSFLVLMREAGDETTAADLVFDPHILPNGQTAVLWVREDLMRKTGGDVLVSAAQRDLTFRPRAMNVELPHLTDAVQAWAQSIVGNVSLPGGMEFTSMEFGDAGLMLSATPLSVEELDALTARDLTQGPEDLVQPHAEALFGDCMYFHMEPKYRKNLLDAAKPELPQEVIDVSKPHAKFYRKFGRLQMAQAISDSDVAKHKPFVRIQQPKTQRALKKLSSSSTYAAQTGQLYALAFCKVRPRISLYMEDAERWREAYFDYITSPDYADRLFEQEEAAQVIHESVSKLAVLDLSGETAAKAHEALMGAIAVRVADTRWQSFAKEMPDDVESALEATAEQARESAEKRLAELEAKTEPLTEDEQAEKEQAEEAVEVINWLAQFGKIGSTLLGAMVTYAPEPDRINLLKSVVEDAVDDAAAQAPNAPNKLAASRVIYGFAAMALAIVFFVNARQMLDTEGMSGVEKAKRYFEFAVGLYGAIYGLGTGFLSLVEVGRYAYRLFQGQASAQAAGVLGRAAGLTKVLRWGGAVLAVLATFVSLFNFAESVAKGEVGPAIVDGLLVVVGVLQTLAIALAWSGPVAIALAVIGIGLALVRAFAFRDKEQDDARRAAGELVDQLERDGAAVAA